MKKYYAEKGSNITMAVYGVVLARARGCIGFEEYQHSGDGKVVGHAIGYREDHIPDNVDISSLVEVTEEIINDKLARC